MSDVDMLACRAAITEEIVSVSERGAKAELVDFVDPYRSEGEEALLARDLIDRARAETAAALRTGARNPQVLRNGIDGPGTAHWLDLRKSAMALHPLYEAGSWEWMGAGVTMADINRAFPGGEFPVEILARAIGEVAAARTVARYEAFLGVRARDAPLRFMRGCLDACAIRSRASAAAMLVAERSARWNRPIRLTSLACGAAKPIARVAADLHNHGQSVETLTLLDRDPLALAAGRAVAEAMSCEVPVHVVLSDLLILRERRAIDVLAALNGQGQELIEMLGLFEYLPDRLAVDLLRRAGDALAPGGLIVLANMLTPRPEQDVFSDVIQWPAVIQRSMPDLLDLIEAAGFTSQSVSIVVPESELIYQIAAIDPTLD